MSDTETEIPVVQAKKRGRGAPKGKRTPTPLQLEMLAKARAKANEIRKQQQIVKQETYEELIEEVTRFEPDIKMPSNEPKPVDTDKSWAREFIPSRPFPQGLTPRGNPPPDLPTTCESIVTPDEIRNENAKASEKEKKKKKTRIIIEQSSSDEDVFENTEDVIFVKRRGRKDPPKKTVEAAPVPVAPGAVPVPAVAPGAVIDPYFSTKRFTSEPSSYFNKRFY
jgi:hypothetical protein